MSTRLITRATTINANSGVYKSIATCCQFSTEDIVRHTDVSFDCYSTTVCHLVGPAASAAAAATLEANGGGMHMVASQWNSFGSVDPNQYWIRSTTASSGAMFIHMQL